MAKKPRRTEEYDSPWKGTLQLFLQAFLEFFFADIADDITSRVRANTTRTLSSACFITTSRHIRCIIGTL
jgi:hypothetical protein